MYSYSYNPPSSSISRLDELLNRNEMIYQNLKQKLDGINKSNQNIYRNISHIHSNYHDPFSQESSAIEKEPTIKNGLASVHHEQSVSEQQYYKERAEINHQLPRIDQHNQVTFSEETNRLMEQEYQEQKLLKLIREEDRLRELQLLLERERLIEEERLIEMQRQRWRREEESRRSSSSSRVRKSKYTYIEEQKPANQQIERKLFQIESKREAIDNNLPEQPNPAPKVLKYQRDSKPLVKNNSIYLSQIPKTSIGSTSEIEQQIPTFRQINEQNGSYQEEKDKKHEQSGSGERTQKRIDNEAKKRERYMMETLQELSSKRANIKERNQNTEIYQKKEKSEQQISNYSFKSKANDSRQTKQQKKSNIYLNISTDRKDQDKKPSNPAEFSNIKILQSSQFMDNDFDNLMGRSKTNTENQTPYRELNNNLKLKLDQIETIPQCFLFAPFNKVYRSPILQIKSTNVTLERKSKTSALAVNRNKLVDGIRYKFKTIITDEQLLLKQLFNGQDQINWQHKQSNKVAIVGGREVLKKKLHMGLIAYSYELLAYEIQKSSKFMMVRIEHQEINPQEEPVILETSIEYEPGSKKIALMKLEKVIEDVYEIIKKTGATKGGHKKILRMTKLMLMIDNSHDWSLNVISSNRYDYEFLRYLKVNKICWAINPLVKYYDDVKDTLDSMRHYQQAKRSK